MGVAQEIVDAFMQDFVIALKTGLSKQVRAARSRPRAAAAVIAARARIGSQSIPDSHSFTVPRNSQQNLIQTREMQWAEFAAQRPVEAATAAAAAEERVESMLEQAQEASVQTVAGAPRTTRAARGRRGATMSLMV